MSILYNHAHKTHADVLDTPTYGDLHSAGLPRTPSFPVAPYPGARHTNPGTPGSVVTTTSWNSGLLPDYKNELATPLWDMAPPPPHAAWIKDAPGAASGFATPNCYQTADYTLQMQNSVDAYKSLLNSVGDHVVGGVSDKTTTTSTATSISAAPSTPASSSRSSKSSRYTNCTCPNCTEAERLGISGDNLRKFANVHSCHIPGCGKVCLFFNASNINYIFTIIKCIIYICWYKNVYANIELCIT